jgi:hypothetical protein
VHEEFYFITKFLQISFLYVERIYIAFKYNSIKRFCKFVSDYYYYKKNIQKKGTKPFQYMFLLKAETKSKLVVGAFGTLVTDCKITKKII